MENRGKYIVIEGGDGTGKSTVANLVAEKLRNDGRDVIRVDEPDSAKNDLNEPLVPIASELRRIIKDGSLGRTALTNILLFTAQRRENWLQATKPALDSGIDVVSARNYWSTEVYQGYGEGYNRHIIRGLTRFAVGKEYMRPDYTFILDLDDEVERQKRIASRGNLETPDTFESRDDDFQNKLLTGYRKLARKNGVRPIMSTKPPTAIADEIYRGIDF